MSLRIWRQAQRCHSYYGDKLSDVTEIMVTSSVMSLRLWRQAQRWRWAHWDKLSDVTDFVEPPLNFKTQASKAELYNLLKRFLLNLNCSSRNFIKHGYFKGNFALMKKRYLSNNNIYWYSYTFSFRTRILGLAITSSMNQTQKWRLPAVPAFADLFKMSLKQKNIQKTERGRSWLYHGLNLFPALSL
jgi:hypothetical protein